MPTNYEDIFRHRGGSYHKAMKDFPGVRTLEFQQLFLRQPLREKEVILDCPALGGYLSENLQTDVETLSYDFCPQGDSVFPIQELGIGKQVDRIVCLASSHHINNLGEFISLLTPFLKGGGVFHLADVGHDGQIRHFLDDFVGKWTSTGHSGIWRDLSLVFQSEPYESQWGLKTVAVEVRDCPWFFESEERMINFVRLLFGLDLNPSDQEILDALHHYLGLRYADQGCIIPWKLTYVDCIKNAST